MPRPMGEALQIRKEAIRRSNTRRQSKIPKRNKTNSFKQRYVRQRARTERYLLKIRHNFSKESTRRILLFCQRIEKSENQQVQS